MASIAKWMNMTITPEVLDFLDDHWCKKMFAEAQRQPLGPTPEASIQKLMELRQHFHDELHKMPPDNLTSLVAQVLWQQDQDRPFNAFGTEADYEHFGRCACLSVYEAVAVSMGKDPRRVPWTMVQPHVGSSLFANEFADRLDRLERAIIWGELPSLFSPLQFLTWAHEYKTPVPKAFIDRTFDRGEPIQYWHDLCQTLSSEIASLKAELEVEHVINNVLLAESAAQSKTFDDWLSSQDEIKRLEVEHEANVASLGSQLLELQSQNAALREQMQQTAQIQAEPLATSERKSMLTMIAAMATDGYGHDPAAAQSKTVGEILSACDKIGLPICDDTVRKYLKEATSQAGFIGPDMERRKPKSGKAKPKSV